MKPDKWKLYLCTGLVLAMGSSPVFAAGSDPLTNITLNQDLLDSINLALPEGNAADAEYLSSAYDPTVRLVDDAQISVTFLNEGAGYRNSLGYFTFDSGTFSDLSFGSIDTDASGNIDYAELLAIDGVTSTGVIFDNASKSGSGGSLVAGDTAVLGGGTVTQNTDGSLDMSGGDVFSAGTNMGFFLVQNGWDGQGVKGIDSVADPLMIFSTDLLNPENSPSATSGNTAQSARHTAMMFADDPADGLIIGFEDLHRTDRTENANGYSTDEDFNDLIFVVNASPYTALGGTNAPTINTVILGAPAGILGSNAGSAALLITLFFGWRYRRHYRCQTV